MRDLFLIFVLLVGAAVALFAGLVLWQADGPPPGPASASPGAPEEGAPAPAPAPAPPGSAEEPPPLPLKIEGFRFVNFERADPAFPGEEYSVTVFFAPDEGSPYEGVVESLGITRFQLTDATSGAAIRETLLLLGEETEEITVNGVSMTSFVNEPVGLAGLAWQEGLQVYYILVSGVVTAAGGAPPATLQEAARIAAQAVLAQRQSGPPDNGQGE